MEYQSGGAHYTETKSCSLKRYHGEGRKSEEIPRGGGQADQKPQADEIQGDIYIYIHTHTHTHTHMYIYIYVYLYLSISISRRLRTCRMGVASG